MCKFPSTICLLSFEHLFLTYLLTLSADLFDIMGGNIKISHLHMKVEDAVIRMIFSLVL